MEWGSRRLIESTATEVAKGESEQRVFLRQQLSGTGVESYSSGDETETTTSPSDGGILSELGDHEQEEGQIEHGKESDQCDVDPQGTQPAEKRG